MGLLRKLKAAGGGLKDVGGGVSGYASRLKTNVEKEISTPGSSGQRFADAPLGFTYMLPKPVQKAVGFAGVPTPRKTVRDTAAFASRPGVGTGLALGGDVAGIATLPALVASPLKGIKAAGSATTTLRTRAPLAFPNTAPERSMVGRVKNVINTKMAQDRAATAFTAQRNAELPGKISAIKTEIARIEALGSRSTQATGGKTGNITNIATKLKGEEGSLRFPAGSPKKIQQAHANVPKNQLLFTAEEGTPATGEVMAFTKNQSIAASAERSVLMDRAVADVRSGRAKLAGFYEKIKSEKGWVRVADKPASKTPSGIKTKAHTQVRVGEGKFPGESALGVGPAKRGFYEAHLMGSKEPGAVKVAWLVKKGEPGNVARPMEAVTKGLRARGITAIEHEPLSDSRSRLFARQLRQMGMKNLDRNAPDIKKKPSLATGWGR